MGKKKSTSKQKDEQDWAFLNSLVVDNSLTHEEFRKMILGHLTRRKNQETKGKKDKFSYDEFKESLMKLPLIKSSEMLLVQEVTKTMQIVFLALCTCVENDTSPQDFYTIFNMIYLWSTVVFSIEFPKFLFKSLMSGDIKGMYLFTNPVVLYATFYPQIPDYRLQKYYLSQLIFLQTITFAEKLTPTFYHNVYDFLDPHFLTMLAYHALVEQFDLDFFRDIWNLVMHKKVDEFAHLPCYHMMAQMMGVKKDLSTEANSEVKKVEGTKELKQIEGSSVEVAKPSNSEGKVVSSFRVKNVTYLRVRSQYHPLPHIAGAMVPIGHFKAEFKNIDELLGSNLITDTANCLVRYTWGESVKKGERVVPLDSTANSIVYDFGTANQDDLADWMSNLRDPFDVNRLFFNFEWINLYGWAPPQKDLPTES